MSLGHRFAIIFTCLNLCLYSIEDSYRDKFAPVVKENSQFAFDLYHQLKSQNGNLFFSPYNIDVAFSMTLMGARGETEEEMRRVLYFSNQSAELRKALNKFLFDSNGVSKEGDQFAMSNALWVQEGFPLLPNFQQNMENNYRALIQNVNFEDQPAQAIQAVNQWVTRMTKGKINQLLTERDVSELTRLILTSTLYMKDQWSAPFDQRNTERAPFHLGNGHSLQVNMMHATAHYPVFIHSKFDMIELSYRGLSPNKPQLAMLILLPRDAKGLYQLEKDLTSDRWTGWLDQLEDRFVALSLPKFRLENRLDLNQTMIELGMVSAFNPQANFSGISKHAGLYINKAIHKTFVQVDEKGTEAAAATAIGMNLTSIRQPAEPYVIEVNHPFIFLIMDKTTRTIIFMGRCMQP